MPKQVQKRAKSAPKSTKKAVAIKKSPKKAEKKANSAKVSPAKKNPDAPKWVAPFTKTIKQWHDVDQYFQMNIKY